MHEDSKNAGNSPEPPHTGSSVPSSQETSQAAEQGAERRMPGGGSPETPERGAESPAAAAEGEGEISAAPGAGVEAELAALQAEMKTLEAEKLALKDQLLRAHADMENLRKRMEREKADTAKYAIAKFARDVIEAGDSFQYAVNAVPPGAAEKDPALKSFLDGVILAERAFLAVLDRHGLRQINPQGAPFDPHEHYAAGEEQNPEVVPGTVVKVYQVGYKLEDRVLRPAMVVIAKGGKKPDLAGASSAQAHLEKGGEQREAELKPPPSEEEREKSGNAPNDDGEDRKGESRETGPQTEKPPKATN